MSDNIQEALKWLRIITARQAKHEWHDNNYSTIVQSLQLLNEVEINLLSIKAMDLNHFVEAIVESDLQKIKALRGE